MTLHSKDFPPQYKAAVDIANQQLKDGAVRILAICEEQTQASGNEVHYTLDIRPDITVTITRKKPVDFMEDVKKHGI